MHAASIARAAHGARFGLADELAGMLAASRADTLATFACYEATLPSLTVPLDPTLNPPLWELGHIGWFQEYWIARNPERGRGAQADPEVVRAPSLRAGADALYDSSRVAHDRRWHLALPEARATREDLAGQLAQTLALLTQAAGTDDALYFFRLALLHEDMHHEAALYMARSLGIPIHDARWRARALPEPSQTRDAVPLTPQRWMLGHAGSGGDGSGNGTGNGSDSRGFVFDNELAGVALELPGGTIDATAVRWAEFLPFVESGGYAQPQWWSEAGLHWLASKAARVPRYLRHGSRGWEHWLDGRWQPLDLSLAACHLTFHEAQAWCRWAGRRLPTEAEWECAACTAGADFRWGDVWEWTASPFAPFPGFRAHPYRDYSAPWFDGRPVLKGASYLTQPRMRDPKYRNFFQADRDDVPAGFRSCAC